MVPDHPPPSWWPNASFLHHWTSLWLHVHWVSLLCKLSCAPGPKYCISCSHDFGIIVLTHNSYIKCIWIWMWIQMHPYPAPWPVFRRIFHYDVHRNLTEPLHVPHPHPGTSLLLTLTLGDLSAAHLVQSNTDTSLKVQFWNLLLLEGLHRQSEVVSASMNATELSLYVQHGNHYHVQPFYSCKLVLSSLGLCHDLYNGKWPYFLHSPQYNDFPSFIHSTNVYGATYMPSPVLGSGDTVVDDTKSLISGSLQFSAHNRCSVNIC